jgi:hypothetical protein
MVIIFATHPAKCLNQQAILKIDWSSNVAEHTSVYLACGTYDDLPIQICSAASSISKKYMSEDERT